MSAFVVDNSHINALISFAKLYDAHIYFDPERCEKKGWVPYVFGKVDLNDPKQLDWLAQTLLDENVRSVDYRYGPGDDAPATKGGEWADPVEKQTIEFKQVFPIGSGLDVLSMCGCYDYQACETPDYEDTLAHFIVNRIRHTAIRAIPGYDKATYHYTGR